MSYCLQNTRPKLYLVASVDRHGGIGSQGKLLHRNKADMKRFRQLTMGRVVLMGRKTFESIGKPLKGRTNVILSRDPTFSAEGCTVYSSLEEVLDSVDSDIFVIGGSEIYKQTIDLADKIYLTYFDRESTPDAYFPTMINWDMTSEENLDDDVWFYTYEKSN